MSWNPNQQQVPNPSNPYGDYAPPVQQTDPYSNQQQGYGYQSPYSAPPVAGGGAPGESTMGMQPNTAAGLSYLAGWVTGLIFFLLEKKNRFVRFHAAQSILFFGGLTVLDVVLGIASSFSPGFLGLAFSCLSGVLGLVGFVGWIVLLINGFQGKYFKLPVIGDYAERYANQGITKL